MNHGGARPGAGRKRGAFTKDMSSLLKETVTPDDWRRVMRTLVERAAGGDIRAIQFLLRSRYGDNKDGATDAEYLTTIRIIDPNHEEGFVPYELARQRFMAELQRAREQGEADPILPDSLPDLEMPPRQPQPPSGRIARAPGRKR